MSLNLYKYHTNPETIAGYDQAMNSVPHLAWDHFRNKPKELRKREHIWAQSAEYSHLYAIYVLKGERFEKGEDAIATDARWSCNYAKDVLKGRFEKGEDAIATDAGYSLIYVTDVLDGKRVKKFEDAIVTSAQYSYWYAREVLKGRSEKFEDAIATDVWYSYAYVRDVLKGERFEKGEDVIRGSEYKSRYEHLTGVKL